MSDKQVSEWLAGEDAYTLHKPAQINYKRNRVIVHGIDIQFQADLVDMSMYTKKNDNFKYMLTCIDFFSKYAWTRVLKNKTGVEVTKAFESILKEGRIPQKLQTDRGEEFFNKYFQDVTIKYNIHHFATGSELKASIVERFNRTIKGRMWRYLTAVNSKRYIDVLQDLITSYNNSYHRSIKMRPVDVSRENENKVFKTLYGLKDAKDSNVVFNRFTISECIPRTPPVYKLKDFDGDIIDGCFYEEELQKIEVGRDKSFKLEKILESKKVGKKVCMAFKIQQLGS